MPFFCGDFLKKESTVIGLAQEVWWTFITFKRLLTELTNTRFEKMQERRAEREDMSTRKWGNVSTSAVITYFLTHFF